ncbi:MAG: YigZ family protein [Bacteroidia bacterium]
MTETTNYNQEMLFDDSYKTIATLSEGIFRDRGSKFIGLLFPIKNEIEFKKHYNELKKLHHKANHHCYAIRLTPDRSIFKSSDDREPAGTAGRPILNTLLSNDTTDCGLIVVRYFGGTLLGVPGLINAYKSAAEESVKNATIILKEITEHYQLNFNYDLMNDVMNLLKNHSAKIYENTFENECIIKFEIAKSKADLLINEITTNYLFKDKIKIRSNDNTGSTTHA